MGGIINPVGNRLGRFVFWPNTYPLSYNLPFKGAELGGSIRLLFNCWMRVLSRLYQRDSKYQIQSMLLGVVSNVWGFCGNRLSVYLSLYDYRLADRVVGSIPHRWFFKKFLRFMYQNSLMLRTPSILIKQNALESSYLLRRSRIRSLEWRTRRYVRRYFKYVRVVVGRRLANWHRVLIIFTKPYLFRLASLYNLQRVFVVAKLQRSSFTASLVARYVVLRLKQNTSLNYLIKQLRWGMLEMGFGQALGYKVCFAGRFSRKQIATYRWARVGLAGVNRLNVSVDYAYDYGFTRFGAYGFKLWVYYEGSTVN
jgi:hypothetical protein